MLRHRAIPAEEPLLGDLYASFHWKSRITPSGVSQTPSSKSTFLTRFILHVHNRPERGVLPCESLKDARDTLDFDSGPEI